MVKKASSIFYLIILIIVISIFMRFFLLDLRPMYFDEGTHWSSFINRIYTGQSLDYLPDFHGFTSWFLSAAPMFVLGTSIFAFRFMVALIGSLTIILLFLLKDKIGKFGILLTALFMSISPTFIFYSRQVSQYPYIIFFTLLSLIFFVLYIEENKRYYFYFYSLASALLFTTHELGIIFIAVIISFIIIIYYFNPEGKKLVLKQYKKLKEEKFKTLIISLILFILIVILIMSSFLTNFKTLSDFLNQSSFQFNKSFNTGHNKNMFYYIKTFWMLEIFAFLGTLLSIFYLKRNMFSLFLFSWTFLSIMIFSLISYKVPWMFMIPLLPMYLLSGLIFENINEKLKDKKTLKNIFYIILIALFIFTLYNSIRINYIYENGSLGINPLNYAGPADDNYRMINDINELIPNKTTRILFVGDGLWPLHYYLRDYRLNFIGEDINLDDYCNDYDLIIISDNRYYNNNTFHRLGRYELRQNYFINILTKKSVNECSLNNDSSRIGFNIQENPLIKV